MSTITQDPRSRAIGENSITLSDAQFRIKNFHDKLVNDLHIPSDETPISIVIPFQDLKNIVDGFKQAEEGYTVTAARLYLTFSPNDSYFISGVIVPVGYATVGGNPDDTADIIISTETIPVPIGPDTFVSAYDFTSPCPPVGNCIGASPYFRG